MPGMANASHHQGLLVKLALPEFAERRVSRYTYHILPAGEQAQ